MIFEERHQLNLTLTFIELSFFGTIKISQKRRNKATSCEQSEFFMRYLLMTRAFQHILLVQSILVHNGSGLFDFPRRD